MSTTEKAWKQLDFAVVGAGLGGLTTALSLRRAGHKVTIYERYDFSGEVGASLSVASNGSRWLLKWDLDMDAVQPVILRNLLMHDWETGKVTKQYGLGDYKEKFGSVRRQSAMRWAATGGALSVETGILQLPPH